MVPGNSMSAGMVGRRAVDGHVIFTPRSGPLRVLLADLGGQLALAVNFE